jgi:hypothetical protein
LQARGRIAHWWPSASRAARCSSAISATARR